MTVRELSASYRQFATPSANLCLATSLGAAAVAGLSTVVDKLIVSWPIAPGMLVVSAFYLVLGTVYLIQHGVRSDRFRAEFADPLRRLGMNVQNHCSVDHLGGEGNAVTPPAREMDERQAIAESCQWAG